MRVRRSFTPEFKAEVVALARRGDRSIGQISQDMDLVESVIRRWVAQADVDEGRRPGTTSTEQEEIMALRKRVRTDKAIYNAEQVRNEMFMAFDYYVTESSGHNSEYNWWFRKRPDLIEKYCTHGTNWNPGHYAYILNSYAGRTNRWKNDIRNWINNPDWERPRKRKQLLARGGEYASCIINAWLGGELYRFNGNVLNTGNLVTNLPDDCCVEIPVLAARRSIRPMHVGALPRQVVPLTSLNATCETLAVEAALTGDPRKVYQAVACDPLTASVLSLEEIRHMVDDMLAQNRDHLPQFKHFKV